MQKPPWKKLRLLFQSGGLRRNPVFAWDLRSHARAGPLLRQLLARVAALTLLYLLSPSLVWAVGRSPDPELQAILANGTWLGGFAFILIFLCCLETDLRASMAWKSGPEDELFAGLLTSPLASREILAGRLGAALFITCWLHAPSFVAVGMLFAWIPPPQQVPIGTALVTLPVALGSFILIMAEPPPLGRDVRPEISHHVRMLAQLALFGGLAIASHRLLMLSPSLSAPVLAGGAALVAAMGALATRWSYGYALQRLDQVRLIAVQLPTS